MACEQGGTLSRGGRLTNDTLPEEVGLAFGRRRARELPVNFILDVGHRDERGDDTSPTASLDCNDVSRCTRTVRC